MKCLNILYMRTCMRDVCVCLCFFFSFFSLFFSLVSFFPPPPPLSFYSFSFLLPLIHLIHLFLSNYWVHEKYDMIELFIAKKSKYHISTFKISPNKELLMTINVKQFIDEGYFFMCVNCVLKYANVTMPYL